MTRYDAAKYDDQVRLLFKAGYGFEGIARVLGEFDARTIRRHCLRMGLLAAAPHANPVRTPTPAGPDPTNPVEHARRILGSRVTERGGAYWLDNRRPVSARELVQEANRARARDGKPPIGPEGWR